MVLLLCCSFLKQIRTQLSVSLVNTAGTGIITKYSNYFCLNKEKKNTSRLEQKQIKAKRCIYVPAKLLMPVSDCLLKGS